MRRRETRGRRERRHERQEIRREERSRGSSSALGAGDSTNPGTPEPSPVSPTPAPVSPPEEARSSPSKLSPAAESDSGSVPDDHPDALRKGTRVKEYKIVRILGQGGFGITYLAFDLNLNGAVALKEYFPTGYARRLADGSVDPASGDTRDVFDWGLKRFLDEARAIHRLRHPNVVRAHRFFEARGGAFIVMEYVEGDSLANILKDRRQLTFAEWRPVVDNLLDGLEHVHDHDYLHRDLKPGNIVVRDTDGSPVLIDFGSARIATGERTQTQMVTDGYAPIEQYGRGKQGPPADLYGLAAVSYRVLLGERPPIAPDRVTNDTIALLAERVTGTERGWLAALDRCLALQPKDRPQSVAELRKQLRQPSVSPDRPAVQKFRQRFGTPKSGRGKALVEPLSPPFDDWSVRRWVGRRTSGAISAAAFAPFHRIGGTDAGDKPLFQKRVNSEAEGFAWLLELEKSGALEEAARGRIESVAGPQNRSEPQPSHPPTGTLAKDKSDRRSPRITINTRGGSSVMTLSELKRQLREKREKDVEERAQSTGKAVLALWYGSPLAAAMCDSGGGDSIWLVGIAGLVTAVIACAAAFDISKQNGVLMLATFAVLLGAGILGVQQGSVWAFWSLMMLYVFGGAGVRWVGTRLWRRQQSAGDGLAA